MVLIPVQRTIQDILASTEVDACMRHKGPFANVRDWTMHVMVAVLEILVEDGNKMRANVGEYPDVPLDMYLQRFFKYTPCKKDTYIASLIYLDYKITRFGTVIDSTNVHRLFLSCSLTAAKLVEDVTSDCAFNNKLFAIVGGVPLLEMNELELEFLGSMGYRVHIFPCEFHRYSDAVNAKVSMLREDYLRGVGINDSAEVNIDESSAHMIYSLIFDSHPTHEKRYERGHCKEKVATTCGDGTEIAYPCASDAQTCVDAQQRSRDSHHLHAEYEQPHTTDGVLCVQDGADEYPYIYAAQPCAKIAQPCMTSAQGMRVPSDPNYVAYKVNTSDSCGYTNKRCDVRGYDTSSQHFNAGGCDRSNYTAEGRDAGAYNAERCGTTNNNCAKSHVSNAATTKAGFTKTFAEITQKMDPTSALSHSATQGTNASPDTKKGKRRRNKKKKQQVLLLQ